MREYFLFLQMIHRISRRRPHSSKGFFPGGRWEWRAQGRAGWVGAPLPQGNPCAGAMDPPGRVPVLQDRSQTADPDPTPQELQGILGEHEPQAKAAFLNHNADRWLVQNTEESQFRANSVSHIPESPRASNKHPLTSIII